MTKDEYNKLKEVDTIKEKCISIEDLNNKNDRTLLYGFNCNRDTWHVYIKNNCIYTVAYSYKGEPIEVSVMSNEDYVPDKRLYPKRCDFEFCELLSQKGINLPFTTWQDDMEYSVYYGETK